MPSSDWNEAIEQAAVSLCKRATELRNDINSGKIEGKIAGAIVFELEIRASVIRSLKRPADQDGWKLVPVEPTIEMHAGDAATLAEEVLMKGFWGDWEMPGPPTGSAIATAIYKAMLASAPTPEAK